MITVWNDTYSIEPLKDKGALSILSIISALLGSINCLYWVSYGTALGLYRDRKLIDEDTDIDISIIGNHMIKDIKDIFNEQNGFKLVRTTIDKSDGFIYQIAFIHIKTNIIVDITFFRGLDNKLYTIAEKSGRYEYPIEFLSEIIYHSFNDVFYPMINPEKYLKYVYGKNWKIPLSKAETKYYWGKDE